MPRARLPQPPRLAPAALARRGADPARRHGRRRRDRRRGHEDGGGPRHRPRRHGRARADRPRHDRRRTARPPGAARRRPDGARARGAVARRASRSRRSRRRASPTRTRSTTRRRASTGRRPPRVVHNQVRGLSPFPGAFFEADFGKGRERVKVLRTTLAEGAGRRARSSTSTGRSRAGREPCG